MSYVQTSAKLTDEGVEALLAAAISAARSMGQPQCIAIVDASGVELAIFRMSGSRYLSVASALAKARTAASINGASNSIPEQARLLLAAATKGEATGLRGGLPIRMNGTLVGGIGVGSGSGEQDEQVARAALAAIGAEDI
jgi:uncharacterized protein GlcG (DUF336 family)